MSEQLIEFLRGELDRKTVEADGQRRDKEAAEADNERLREKVAELEDCIRLQKDVVESNHKVAVGRQQLIEERDARIAELEKKLAEMEAKSGQLLSEGESKFAATLRAMEGLEKTIADLRRQLAEREGASKYDGYWRNRLTTDGSFWRVKGEDVRNYGPDGSERLNASMSYARSLIDAGEWTRITPPAAPEPAKAEGATFSPGPWTFKNGDAGIRDANGKVVISGICGQLAADFVLAAAAPELYHLLRRFADHQAIDRNFVKGLLARIEGRQA